MIQRYIARFLATVALAGAWSTSAEMNVYYLRHGQGGHNIDEDYVRRHVPKEEWTNWMDKVGNSHVFTPLGVQQVQALATNLLPFRFDFIAVSPKWRALHTILPYLKATGRTAEIWPELMETGGGSDLSDEAARQVGKKLFAGTADIKLSAEEQPYFHLRADGSGSRLLAPASPADFGALARKVETLLRDRFGTNDVNVLLVGHGTAGLTLIRRLTRTPLPTAHIMDNTHLWLVRGGKEGDFSFEYYDLSATKAAAEPKR